MAIISPETYERLAHRINHRPRLAYGIRTFAGFQISRLVNGGQFRFETDGMEGHFLCFPFAEGARIAYRQERFRQEGVVEPGQITLLPAGRSACWKVETPPQVNTLNLYIAPDLVAAVADRAAVFLQRPPWFQDPHLLRLAELLGEEIEADCPAGTLYSDTLVRAIAARLIGRYAEAPLSAPVLRSARHEIRQAKEILLSSLAEDHSIESLSRAVGLSPSHLSRLFKAGTGKSLYAFLLESRLDAAHTLLRTGRANVSEAAAACGFYDPAHLARHFRRRYGAAPRTLMPK